MKTKSFKSSLLLFLAAFIWGVAFVAQSVGMDYVGPFTFNAVRCFVGSLVLIPVIFWNQKRTAKKVDKDTLHDRPKESILGGITGLLPVCRSLLLIVDTDIHIFCIEVCFRYFECNCNISIIIQDRICAFTIVIL